MSGEYFDMPLIIAAFEAHLQAGTRLPSMARAVCSCKIGKGDCDARRILRTAVLAMAATGLASFAPAQQLSPKSTCVNQNADAPGVTAIKLIRDGYEIKAGWPLAAEEAGNLLLQYRPAIGRRDPVLDAE